MIHVYTSGAYVASINKQAKAADAYQASAPWLLLMADGKVRRFGTHAEARDEAQKRFPRCTFKRT